MISFHFANENKKYDTEWCYLIKQRSVGGIKNQNKVPASHLKNWKSSWAITDHTGFGNSGAPD